MTTTHTTVKKSFARRIARIAATLTLFAGVTSAIGVAAPAAIAAPAGAHGSCAQPFFATVRQYNRSAPVFPVGDYGRGSRDVEIRTSCGAPGGHVWYGVKDTMTGVWYGGWAYADQSGNLSAPITGIPALSCGHTLVADASDWGEVGAPAAAETTFIDNCTPEVNMDANGYIFGDEFTPGARYILSVTDNADPRIILFPRTIVTASTLRDNVLGPPTPQGTISLATTVRTGGNPSGFCLVKVLDQNGAYVTQGQAYC